MALSYSKSDGTLTSSKKIRKLLSVVSEKNFQQKEKRSNRQTNIWIKGISKDFHYVGLYPFLGNQKKSMEILYNFSM